MNTKLITEEHFFFNHTTPPTACFPGQLLHHSSPTTILVFIHGFLGEEKDWLIHLEQLQKLLKPQHHSFYAFLISPHRMHRDLSLFYNELQQTLHRYQLSFPIHLIGYSLGGRQALSYAHQYPQTVSSLTLISTHPGLDNDDLDSIRIKSERKNQDEQLALQLEHLIFSSKEAKRNFISDWYHLPLYGSLSSDHQFLALVEKRLHQSFSLLPSLVRMWSLSQQPSFWSFLQTPPFHLLIMVGEEDEKYKQCALKLQFQHHPSPLYHYRFHVVSHTGHYLHFQNPKLFSETLLKHLEEC
jgi:2-succinyl-6-hydroxy-2,4-cyclohexadiene-1-carboxylate synthase